MPVSVSSYILSKLDHIAGTLRSIAAADFPHKSGEKAIRALQVAIDDEKRLILEVIELRDENSLVGLCRTINRKLYRLLPILGFILRSTHVRNSFEIVRPLERLTQQILGREVSLLLSSEWDYVPFAYPFSITELPLCVFVGLPASESQNPLLFPVAGHEIGHAVWKKFNLEGPAYITAELAAEQDFKANEKDFVRRFPEFKSLNQKQSDLYLKERTGLSIAFAVQYLEELFCDIVALKLFGEAYLYAFQYLLSPNMGLPRSEQYPSIELRLKAMHEFASQHRVDMPPHYINSFEDNPPRLTDQARFLITAAERVARSLVPGLIERANKIIPVSASYDHPDLSDVEANLRARIPARRPLSLSQILNAAWNIQFDIYNGIEIGFAERELIDLTLKSIEVLEYRSITSRTRG